MFAEIGQREFDVLEFRHAENVREQLLGETDTACPDNSDFETHILHLDPIKC